MISLKTYYLLPSTHYLQYTTLSCHKCPLPITQELNNVTVPTVQPQTNKGSIIVS